MKITSELTFKEYNDGDITFFEKGLTDCQKRKIIDEIGLKNGLSVNILENLAYPKGMTGYIIDDSGMRVVYNRDGMIEDIMDALDCSVEDAEDWYSVNTLRGCPYCYTEESPCPEIIYCCDEEN